MPQADPVASVLMNAPAPFRADAWDAFQQSKDADDFAAKIQAIAIPKEVKAQLWDLKHSAETPAPTWTDKYPKTAQFVRGALDTLPAVGGMVGGVVAAPAAAAATGTVIGIPAALATEASGVGLGVGAGRGARDMIAEKIGIDKPSTPLEKAARIGVDTAVAGGTTLALPGAVEAIKHPLSTIGDFLDKTGGSAIRAIAGPRAATFIKDIKDLLTYTPNEPEAILKQPSWQVRDAVPNGPKLNITADGVLKIKRLIEQGVPQEQAIKTVMALAPKSATLGAP